MRAARTALIILAAMLIAVGVSTTSYAFHSGGVAECGGCHSMHGQGINGGSGFNNLLIAADQSSTCLSCHEHAGDTGPSSYHVSTASSDLPAGTAPKQRGPAGDFGWLRKSFSFLLRGTLTTDEGATLGHNIVASEKGYGADLTNTTAPGGTFSSAQLGCQSCHDPHGKGRRDSTGAYSRSGAPIIGSGSYNNSADPASGQAVGAYRLLAGPGYTYAQGVTWGGWFVAVVPDKYNRTEAATQTRVAYGSDSSTNTVSNWCASCHPDMLGGTGKHVHPVDKNLTNVATNYNTYVKTGDMNGAAASSFTSLVPFAEATVAVATLKSHAKNDDTYLNGPATNDEVMCLSCHRAHASAWDSALRWNQESTFIVANGIYPGIDVTGTDNSMSRGRTTAEIQAAYYDRPVTKFATYQRGLCNKCHAQD